MSPRLPEIRLRPVTEADLSMFRRFLVEPGLIGLDWSGFRDPKAVQRRFDTDSYLGDDDGRLIVDVTAEAESGTESTGLFSESRPPRTPRTPQNSAHWKKPGSPSRASSARPSTERANGATATFTAASAPTPAPSRTRVTQITLCPLSRAWCGAPRSHATVRENPKTSAERTRSALPSPADSRLLELSRGRLQPGHPVVAVMVIGTFAGHPARPTAARPDPIEGTSRRIVGSGRQRPEVAAGHLALTDRAQWPGDPGQARGRP